VLVILEAKLLRMAAYDREQEEGGEKSLNCLFPSPRAPYNIRRSSTSGAEEEEVPFSSDEQKRR
jgi:hypothetical protein